MYLRAGGRFLVHAWLAMHRAPPHQLGLWGSCQSGQECFTSSLKHHTPHEHSEADSMTGIKRDMLLAKQPPVFSKFKVKYRIYTMCAINVSEWTAT